MRRIRVLLTILAAAAAVMLARAARRSRRDDATSTGADAPSLPEPAAEEQARFPIEGYDALRAVDIAATVRTFDDRRRVEQVLAYEQAHHQRVTVFRAAQARLRALEAAAKQPVGV